MEFEYDPSSDMLYIRVKKGKVVDSEEIEEGLIFDYDEEGNVVGIEIVHPRKRRIDMNSVVFDPASALPVVI